jgi:UDPglucose 6-dehydrogenase
VTVVDKDPSRIRKWTSKHPPIHEPGLRDVLRVARDGTRATDVPTEESLGLKVNLPARQPNLFFSTDVERCISEADLIFLSVNTPTKLSGIGAGSATDLYAVELAIQTIAEAAKPGAVIVEKSTVPCRTAKRIRDIVSARQLCQMTSYFQSR